MRGRVEGKGETKTEAQVEAACNAKLHIDDMDICHVKEDGARDLVVLVANCVQSKLSSTKDIAKAPAVHLDYKISWKDMAVQGATKSLP